MKSDIKIQNDLKSKSKKELIKEIIKLNNGNGKSTNKIALNESSELNKLIVENTHDGIMIIGDDYIIE